MAAAHSADFGGRVAVITGASRGIGLACAMDLAARGARVIITGRDENVLREAVARIGANGDGVAGDAADPQHVEATIERALSRHGRVDILINNAGGPLHNGPMMSLDPAQFERTWAFNVEGPFLWTRAVWNRHMSTHGGVVLNIASLAGLTLQSGMGAYAVAKAALLHMTRVLAAELGPKVRVNAIAPGVIATDATASFIEAGGPGLAQRLPMQRFGAVEDIAAAARFLVSDEAGWITGETLAIDGGALVQWGRLRGPRQN